MALSGGMDDDDDGACDCLTMMGLTTSEEVGVGTVD